MLLQKKLGVEKKPNVGYFRIFGCLAYAHVSGSQHIKLDSKSVKCVMLGVSEESKAYRLYNPNTQKIIISRDVVFGEDEGWDWSNGKDQHVTVDLEATKEIEDATPQASQNELPENDSLENNSSEPDEAMTRGTRTRRAPGWLNDYVTREELIDEENGAHFNLFIDSDPITFDEAVKSSK